MTKVTHNSKNGRTNLKVKDSFSSFFHSASKDEKTRVFIKTAEKANKDQRDLVKHANLKLKGI